VLKQVAGDTHANAHVKVKRTIQQHKRTITVQKIIYALGGTHEGKNVDIRIELNKI
jgi:hypothetical protein